MKRGIRFTLCVIALTAFSVLSTDGFSLIRAALAFHFPWDQGHDTFDPDPGDDDNDPGDDACPANTCCLKTKGASPIEFASGNYIYNIRLFRVKGVGSEIDFMLTYNSRDNRKGPFGHGWVYEYDQRLVETTDGVSRYAICAKSNGKRERFIKTPEGSYVSPAYIFDTLSKNTDGTFTIQDVNGTHRRFNLEGRLEAIIDRNGNQLSFSYDETGFIKSIKDASGRTVGFIKGADGRVSSITDPASRTFKFSYDTSGNLIRLTDPIGNSTNYQYDSKNNLIAIIDPNGNPLYQLTYDNEGRVDTYKEGEETWTYTYQPDSKRTLKRDSLGDTWTFVYNNAGNVTQMTDPNGFSEISVYDQNLNITEFTDKNGNKTTYTYDTKGNKTSVTDPLGNVKKMSYGSPFNRLLTTSDNRGSAKHFAYDGKGNLTKITDELGHSSFFEYDTKGQLIKAIDAQGQTYIFSYDGDGNLSRITDPLGNTSNAVFDLTGKAVATTDAEGRTSRFVYNAAERLIQAVNAKGDVAIQEYDAVGNLTAIVMPNGGRTTFEYDSFNRMTKQVNPLGQVTFYSYDKRNNLLSRINPKGQTINYSYDSLDRLIQKKKPDDIVTFTYDQVGNLLTATDNDSSLRFAYDRLNRIVGVNTDSLGGQPASSISYSYDVDGNRLTMTDPQGGTTSYVYDALSHLTSMIGPDSEAFAFSYDALSRRTGMSRPEVLRTIYSHDAVGRVVAIRHEGGPDILEFGYTYDRVGNRQRVTDSLGVHSYSFDALSAITAANNPSGIPSETYEYDTVGNRIHSHLSTSYAYNAANRLTGNDEFDYIYDMNGNLESKTRKTDGQTTRYEYDSENQLIQISLPDGTSVGYRYDAMGRRIGKNVSGHITQYIYDGDDILEEYVNGVFTARYVHGPGTDEILAMRRGSQSIFFQTDVSRSVVRTVSAGATIASFQYDSFGQLIGQTGSFVGPYAFQGREFDQESGLYYFRARYYDPSSGRFISEDPIGFSGGINFYAFARNNPVTLTDARGLYPGEDIVEFFPDALGADKDFWDNYSDMRDASTIGADKYFHCKANCEAARRGPGGDLESWLLSEFRELYQEHLDGDSPADCNADRKANDHGRKSGRENRSVDCGQACAQFRPQALDPKYK